MTSLNSTTVLVYEAIRHHKYSQLHTESIFRLQLQTLAYSTWYWKNVEQTPIVKKATEQYLLRDFKLMGKSAKKISH